MGRSKELPRKGKGVASSSTSKKRARTEPEPRQPQGQCPDWPKNMRLADFPGHRREQMYCDKVADVKLKHNLIIAERKGNISDFRHYGLTECFERLGWLNALSIEGFDQEQVYLDNIITWMSTLKRSQGRNPPRTTKLVGKVRDQDVELSFNTLDTIGSFDNGEKPYEFLSDEEITSDDKNKGHMWIEMLRELFDVPEKKLSLKMSLDRKNLKPLPKLLSTIICWNILPRASDKNTIRNSDVRILYALCTGRPMISFKQLVLHSVWEARESGERKKIPHCRLLSRLLLNANVIPDNARVYNVKHIPFAIANIRSTEFTFTKSRFVYVLKDEKSNRTFEVARENQSEDEEDDGVETENDEEVEAREYDRMERLGEEARPETRPAAWGSWTSYEREMYTEAIRWREEQARISTEWRVAHENNLKTWQEAQAKLAQERWERQEVYEKSRIYEREWEYNRRYEYMEKMRHYFDQTSGQGNQPCPKGYHSAWLPLQSYTPSHTGEGSSSGAQQDQSNMQAIHTSLMESLFQPSHPQSGHDAGGSSH